MQRSRFPWLTLHFALVTVFLLFPLLIIIPMSFSDERYLSFPPQQFGLRWYRAFFEDAVWMKAAWLSLRVAAVASILATVAGTMISAALVRFNFVGKTILMGVILAPMVVPVIIVALGVFLIYTRLGLVGNELGLMAAHAVIGLPFVVMIVSTTLREFDLTIERAARVCGAGPVKAFLLVTLPAILPAILSAALFAFFVSFDELIIALFVLSGSETLPVRIWQDLRFEINPTVNAVATLLIAVTTVAIVLAEMLRKRARARLAGNRLTQSASH